MQTRSYQKTLNLAHFIGLPLSYDHSKVSVENFILLILLPITLLVIDVDIRFLKSLLNSLLDDL